MNTARTARDAYIENLPNVPTMALIEAYAEQMALVHHEDPELAAFARDHVSILRPEIARRVAG